MNLDWYGNRLCYGATWRMTHINLLPEFSLKTFLQPPAVRQQRVHHSSDLWCDVKATGRCSKPRTARNRKKTEVLLMRFAIHHEAHVLSRKSLWVACHIHLFIYFYFLESTGSGHFILVCWHEEATRWSSVTCETKATWGSRTLRLKWLTVNSKKRKFYRLWKLEQLTVQLF